jgi:hypothetical protein
LRSEPAEAEPVGTESSFESREQHEIEALRKTLAVELAIGLNARGVQEGALRNRWRASRQDESLGSRVLC